jgi:hypothetical protein
VTLMMLKSTSSLAVLDSMGFELRKLIKDVVYGGVDCLTSCKRGTVMTGMTLLFVLDIRAASCMVLVLFFFKTLQLF